MTFPRREGGVRMPELSTLGRILLIGGAVLLGLGLLLLLIGKIPGFHWLGRLPGDIYVRREGFTFYAPIATMLILSLVLSLLLNLLRR